MNKKENWNDYDFVIQRVAEDGRDLRFASEELRGDREVVLEAFKRHNEALDYASEELQNEIRQKIEDFINNLK